MPATMIADKPHTLTIPGELFSRIVQIAEGEGQDPDQLTLKTLAAAFHVALPPIEADPAQREPAWKTRLLSAQERTEKARLAAGLTEEEIGADIDAEIKAYRTEQRAMTGNHQQ